MYNCILSLEVKEMYLFINIFLKKMSSDIVENCTFELN